MRTLPFEIVKHIAAGEVVERPASVIKELIENSIDASGKRIKISVVDDGLKEIVVEDDGCGVGEEDFDVIFLPHSTSKIASLKDIYSIKTLGFRGEALFSIASQARVEFSSRRELEYGIRLNLENGKRQKDFVAMQKGTIVRVIDLFYTTPVRKKFLKSRQFERLENRNVVELYASIYNEIEFEYHEDGRLIYRFFPQERLTRIDAVYGVEDVKGNLYLLKADKKIIVVNNRPVYNKAIMKLINEYLEVYGVKSGFIFFISAEPDEVDFNIHPRKLECRFRDENKYIFKLDSEFKTHFKNARASVFIQEEIEPVRITRTLWQANTHEGILIFDQHAVFERISYESFMNLKPLKQELLSPVEVKVDIDEYDVSRLMELGFDVRILKGSILIKAVPQGFYFDETGLQTIIKGLKGRISKHNFALIACRYSIRADDVVSKEAMKDAIKKLMKCIEPRNCPHGRPAFIEIKYDEILRKFERR